MTPEQTQKTCPACGTANRPDCRFCTGCGKEFPKERTCPRCSATVSASQRFCNACGAPVDAVAGAPAGGKMKFCHQCRALIDRDAKFCNQCGAVIADMPLCPRCGDPIGPEEKFCGVCGLPFTSAAPAQQAAIQTVVPPAAPSPPYQPVQPAPVKTGGLPFGKIIAGVVIVLILLVGVVLLLPESPPPPPGGGGGSTGAIVPTGEDPALLQQSEKASRQVLNDAAAALEAGDIAAFSAMLESQELKRLGGTPVFTGSGATKLATALRNAKVKKPAVGVIFYETNTDGTTFGFHTSLEGEKWLIGGL